MHADLVGAAGFDGILMRAAPEPIALPKNSCTLVVGDRMLAAVLYHRHLPGPRAAADIALDDAVLLDRAAPGDAGIGPFDLMFGEGLRERVVGGVVLRGDDQAAGIPLSMRWTMPGRFTPPMPLRTRRNGR